MRTRAKSMAYGLAAALAVLGVLASAWRYQGRKESRLSPSDSTWLVSYNIRYRATSKGGQIQVFPPMNTVHCRIYSQNYDYPKARLEMSPKGTKRGKLMVSTASAGSLEFRASYGLHYMPGKRARKGKPEVLTNGGRARYLQSTDTIQVASRYVRQVVTSLMMDDGDPVDKIYSFCRRDLATTARPNHDALGTLTNLAGSPLGKARAMIALCRSARIPARLVTGVELQPSEDAELVHWVEVFDDGNWVFYDPHAGFCGSRPSSYLPVSIQSPAVAVATRDAGIDSVLVTVRQVPIPAGLFPSRKRSWTDVVRLTRLPLELQSVLALLLLLPFGALINAVARSIVGLRTFGIFTPALLALSFVFADWRSGVVMLALMLILALAGRVVLDQLMLLLMPRLALILTSLVMMMVLSVSVLDHLNLSPDAGAVFLPVVILTMIVERFYVTTAEDGLGRAVQLSIQTLLVAGVCYLMLLWRDLADLILVYPELHFFTCAALILVGRYTGYRLSELWRFHELLHLIRGRHD